MLVSLGDSDDDVRAVAASCLLPIAGYLVEQIPDTLERILLVLWRCLSDMKDDLSSSVGAVMDLLGLSISVLPYMVTYVVPRQAGLVSASD